MLNSCMAFELLLLNIKALNNIKVFFIPDMVCANKIRRFGVDKLVCKGNVSILEAC